MLRSSLPALALLLAGASTAQALIVEGYTAQANERFASAFPSAPIANASAEFLLHGYDLSGVGWRDSNPAAAVTLISPEHFLTAAHTAPAVGSTVSFLGSDGVKRSYIVASVETLLFEGRASDLTLGRLSSAVETAHITSYAGLYLGDAAPVYENLPVAMLGANGRVGLNTVADLGVVDLLPFGGGDSLHDGVVALTTRDTVVGSAQGQGGDSGSPSFVAVSGGQLALWGIHSAVGTISGTELTIDSLPLFTAYAQIDGALQAAGYAGWGYYTSGVTTISAIPEPAATAALLGIASLALIATRRRRRRSGA